MKTYVTPDVFVTEFQANVAVAACNWQGTGQTQTSYDPQTAHCFDSNRTEYVFNTSGCNGAPENIALVAAGEYTVATLNSTYNLGIISDGMNRNKTFTFDTDTYIVTWNGGDCYGTVAASVVEIMTSST